MEKQISRWSYFLGVAGVVVAIGWRLLALFSLAPKGLTSTAHTLTYHYHTVMEGALVMLMITIATGSHLLSKKSVNGRGTSLH